MLWLRVQHGALCHNLVSLELWEVRLRVQHGALCHNLVSLELREVGLRVQHGALCHNLVSLELREVGLRVQHGALYHTHTHTTILLRLCKQYRQTNGGPLTLQWGRQQCLLAACLSSPRRPQRSKRQSLCRPQ